MMISTSNFLNVEADHRTGQNINSVKIDFSKMAFLPPSNQHFTACRNCNALLTMQQHKNVFSKNAKDEYVWNCRFCKQQNASKVLNFCENNYKSIIEKGLKAKITPPIILFVIDNSGSMYQSIFHNMKYANNPQVIADSKKGLQNSFLQTLGRSKLYQQEKELLAKLQANYTQIVKSNKYTQEEISKIALLYAMIEHNLRLLAERPQKIDYRVGFIFVSDMIYVLKGAKQKEIPVYVQRGQLCHEEWPYRKQPIDFYDYDQIFEAGRSYEKYFGDSRLQNFDVGKIAASKVKGGGRTALGPALALAMGIISMHDQGSRIIVATDSLPNFGILADNDSDKIYKRIGNALETNGATLSILKWVGEEAVKTREEESFASFKNAYRDHVEQIQLNLAKCKDNKSLEMSVLSLNHLVSREPIGHSCEVHIYCDNPKITPSKLPFDLSDYKNIRFLNSQSRCWVSLAIDKKALQEYDYLFPIITQTVIKYADLATRQRYLFMSYTKHQLIRPKLMTEPDQENSQSMISLREETINMDNINELCNMELLHLFESSRKFEDKQDKEDIKTVFRYKQIELEREIRDINDIAFLKGQTYEQPDEDENFDKL